MDNRMSPFAKLTNNNMDKCYQQLVSKCRHTYCKANHHGKILNTTVNQEEAERIFLNWFAGQVDDGNIGETNSLIWYSLNYQKI